MATAKKTTTSKITKVAKKAPVATAVPGAKVPVSTSAVKQPVTTISAPAKVSAPVKTISKSEWQAMVEQAAYYIAEKNGFSGDASAHWQQAEAEITKTLKVRGVKVA